MTITRTIHLPINSKAKIRTPRKLMKIQLNFFFDGTKNNYYNTDIRKQWVIDHPEKRNEEDNLVLGYNDNHRHLRDDSYTNSYSNVARLYHHFIPTEENYVYSEKFYIEGVGSKTDERDEWPVPMGAALAIGGRGIYAKIDRAFVELNCGFSNAQNGKANDKDFIDPDINVAKKVEKKISNKAHLSSDGKDKIHRKIDCIDVTLYGFSRGAATARSFCHVILKDDKRNFKKYFKDQFGVTVKDVKIKFVGLFDTVSSYSWLLDMNSKADEVPKDFSDDVKELNLKAIQDAEAVFHLTAADEHRFNFSLTNINSAIEKAVGYEICLPGVHCDIGGAYYDNMDEALPYLANEKDAKEKKEGFYVPPIIRRHPHVDRGYYAGNHEFVKYRKLSYRLMLKEKERLLRLGWFKDDEISIKPPPDIIKLGNHKIAKNNEPLELVASRKSVKNGYSYIPLQLMVDEMENHDLEVDASFKTKYKVASDLDTDIDKLLGYLRKYVKETKVKIDNKDWGNLKDYNAFYRQEETKWIEENQHDNVDLKTIRGKYFHRSAYYNKVGAEAFKPALRDYEEVDESLLKKKKIDESDVKDFELLDKSESDRGALAVHQRMIYDG